MYKSNRSFVVLSKVASSRIKLFQLCTLVLIVAGIGTILLVTSHAQTPFAIADAATGTLSDGTTKVADPTASSGYKVVFGTSGSTTSPGTKITNCYSSPGSCGYPDPVYNNVGVSNCSALPTFQLSDLPSSDYYYTGSGNLINIDTNNVTISNYNLGAWTFIQSGASGLTFNGDCFQTNGDNGSVTSITNTSNGTSFGSHLTVENSTIQSSSCTVAEAASSICTNSSVLSSDIGGGSYTIVKNNILVGAIENVNTLGTGSVVEGNYIVSNAYKSGAHTEDIYSGSGTTNATISHNTMLNPFDETANVFLDNNGTGSCTNNGITVTNNFMAGAGFSIYACSGATTLGSNSFTFTDNDISRCQGTATYDAAIGGQQCGPTPISNYGDAFGAGADSSGLWPRGGYFGLDENVFCNASGTNWSGNHWDDTDASIACGT